MLAPLDNEVFFKKAFTDKVVFKQFIKDIFDIDVNVAKIETEKKFDHKAGYIDFKLDIFAETSDKRFIIEIQRIDYDYNFDRFLHYFLATIIQQQKTSKKYKIQQDVLGILVLTKPYIITQKNDEPIQDSIMTLDFDLKNLKNETIKIWGHNLKFLNAHPKYKDKSIPSNYQDWLNLIQQSVKNDITYTLNLNNPGISKAVKLINFKNITPEELERAKKQEGRKITRKILEEKLEKKDQELEQKDQELEQNQQELEQQDQKLEQKDQELEQNQQELEQQAKLIQKLQEELKNKK